MLHFLPSSHHIVLYSYIQESDLFLPNEMALLDLFNKKLCFPCLDHGQLEMFGFASNT